MDKVHFLVHGFVAGAVQAAAARHIKVASAGAVDFMDEVDAIVFVGGRLDQDGARAVAEDNASRAVSVVNDGRHDVCADDQYALVCAALHKLHARLQGVNKGGAGGGNIVAPSAFRAELVLHQAGRGGEHHVGRDGAKTHRFNVRAR